MDLKMSPAAPRLAVDHSESRQTIFRARAPTRRPVCKGCSLAARRRRLAHRARRGRSSSGGQIYGLCLLYTFHLVASNSQLAQLRATLFSLACSHEEEDEEFSRRLESFTRRGRRRRRRRRRLARRASACAEAARHYGRDSLCMPAISSSPPPPRTPAATDAAISCMPGRNCAAW